MGFKEFYHYKIFLPVSSFLHNVFFWIFHPHKLCQTLRVKKMIEETAVRYRPESNLRIVFVREEIRRWNPIRDKVGDWRPWVITFLARGRKDDCDGAAIFGKWLFELIGYEADIYSLMSESGSHAIAVTRATSGVRYLVTNNELLRIPDRHLSDWKGWAKRLWSPHVVYQKIIKTN